MSLPRLIKKLGLMKRQNRFGKIPLLLLLLFIPSLTLGQVGFNDYFSVSIGPFYGSPGDTVNMPIYIRNQDDPTSFEIDGTIGGITLRIRYDADASMADLLYPVVKYEEIPDISEPDVINYYLEGFVAGRGDGLIYSKPPPDPKIDTTLTVFNQPITDSISDYIIVFYYPPFVQPGEELPHIPAGGPDSTICIYVPMVVNPNAQIGDFTYLYFEDEIVGYWQNQFSNKDGTAFIRPRQRNGGNIFTVSDPNNDPPAVDAISPNTFNVIAGDAVPTVNVSASDPNNDYLCINATNMPSGANFGVSNNQVCGTASTSGSFTWTTTTSDIGTHTIGFYAEDEFGLPSESRFITITVSDQGGGGGAPVVADISPNNITLEQGQAMPGITVSATDPDGETLYLEAISYPPAMTFNPGNPVNGTGSVSMTINWTPSFSDEGVYTVNFQATDVNNNKSTIKSLYITVEKIENDRLYSSSTWGVGTRPVGGIPGATPVIFPIDLVTTKTVYGVNFDMAYPNDVARLDSLGVTDRTPEYLIYDNLHQWPDSIRVVTFGLNNEPVVTGNSSAILNAFFTIDSLALVGDYRVRFYDAWESVDPDPEIPSMELVVDSGIIQVDMMGDVNVDGRINVDDPIKIVSYIIGTFGLPKRNYEAANVISDGLVDVKDLVGVINLFFGFPVESSPAPVDNNMQTAALTLEHEDLTAGQFTKINVSGDFPEEVAALQLQIDYDATSIQLQKPEIPDHLDKYRLDYYDDGIGRMKLVMSTFQSLNSGVWINKGKSDILHLPANVKQDISSNDNSKIRITQATLSSPTAADIPTGGVEPLLPNTFTLKQNYPNPFNPTTIIEFDIAHGGKQHVTLNLYNIIGQKVSTLVDKDMESGTYSVTWNGTDEFGNKVGTGIYLYRLEIGNRAETKKMLLLK
jgi:hypothetical protein